MENNEVSIIAKLLVQNQEWLKAFSEAAKSAKELEKNVGGVKDAIKDTSEQTKTFRQRFEENLKPTEDLRWGLEKTGSAMKSVGTQATIAGGVILGALGMATNAAMDYETQMTAVRKTTGLSAEETAKLKKVFFEMSTDMDRAGAVSVDELMKIGEVAGQLGINGVNNISAFTEQVAKIATVTEFSGEEAATLISKIGAVSKVSAAEMGNFAKQVGSAWNEMANNTNATEKEIAEFQMRISGTGNAIGITTAELIGMSTTMVNMGIEAEMGGTAINRIFMEMQLAAQKMPPDMKSMQDEIAKTTKTISTLENNVSKNKIAMAQLDEQMKNGKISAEVYQMKYQLLTKQMTESEKDLEAAKISLENLKTAEEQGAGAAGNWTDKLQKFAEVAGVSTDDLAKMIKEKPVEAFNLLMKGIEGSTDKVKTMSEVFGSEETGNVAARLAEVIMKISGNTQLLNQNIDMANNAFQKGTSLQNEYAIQTEATSAKVQLAKNNWAQLYNIIGEKLLPVVQSLLSKAIIPLVTWMTKLIDEHSVLSKYIIGLTAAFGGLLAIVGPALIMGGAFAQMLSTFIALKAAILATGIAVKGLVLSIAGPAALIAAAAAAGVGLGMLLNKIDFISNASLKAATAVLKLVGAFTELNKVTGATVGGRADIRDLYNKKMAGEQVGIETIIQTLLAWKNEASAAGMSSAEIKEQIRKWLTIYFPEINMGDVFKALGLRAGGTLSGYGGGDRVPAMLERGETVVSKELTRRLEGFMNMVMPQSSPVAAAVAGPGGMGTVNLGPIYIHGDVNPGNVKKLAKEIIKELKFSRK